MGEMGGERFAGVGPKIEDEVERGEVFGERGRQRSAGVEGAPAGLMLGVGAVDQAGPNAEVGGSGIAGEFDVRGGPVLAQQRERGQGDDKITEGAASKDEDFAHP
jgi:hypothetical protein